MSERSRDLVTVQIPKEWLQGLEVGEETLMQEIVELGFYQWRLRQALKGYRDGGASLGYFAEKYGLAKRDLVQEARARGIDPGFDDATVREELARWQTLRVLCYDCA